MSRAAAAQPRSAPARTAPARRDGTDRISVPPPADAMRLESGIRELRHGGYRPPAPIPRAPKVPSVARPSKAPKPLRSVPPPKPAANLRALARPPAPKPTSSAPKPTRALRSVPPPIPKDARKSIAPKRKASPPPVPRAAAAPVVAAPVEHAVVAPPAPEPAEPAQAAIEPAQQPTGAREPSAAWPTQAAWPEPEPEDDPYIQSLRRSASLVPAPVQRMVSDIRDSLTPEGRANARTQLRALRRDAIVSTIRLLRALADRLSAYA